MFFRGEFFFLSNFYPCEITDRQGNTYATSEHAYQACKCVDPVERRLFVVAPRVQPLTPGQAKRLGRRVRVRPDWDQVKVIAMRRVLALKFAPGSALAKMLLDTGELELVEDNTWGDTFWGRCRGVGQNQLGKLLMERRAELRKLGAVPQPTVITGCWDGAL